MKKCKVGLDGAAYSLAASEPSTDLASSLELTRTLIFLIVDIPSNRNVLLVSIHSCSSKADSSFNASSLPDSLAIAN